MKDLNSYSEKELIILRDKVDKAIARKHKYFYQSLAFKELVDIFKVKDTVIEMDVPCVIEIDTITENYMFRTKTVTEVKEHIYDMMTILVDFDKAIKIPEIKGAISQKIKLRSEAYKLIKKISKEYSIEDQTIANEAFSVYYLKKPLDIIED